MKTNWKEQVFQCFGGLRGALGITLAVLVDHEVNSQTVRIDPRRNPPSQLFGLVGGITLLTLIINGTLSSPILKKLQLNRATEQRMDILARYEVNLRKIVINCLVELLGETYYKSIDFELVTNYVPQLNGLTYMDIRTAIRRVKYTTPSHIYQEPDLAVFEGIVTNDELRRLKAVSRLKLFERIQSDCVHVMAGAMPDELEDDEDEDVSENELKEMRLVFIELLRRSYQDLMKCGHIDVRDGLVVFVLNNSVELTEDEVSNGLPINDWEACKKYNAAFSKHEKTSTKIHLATAFIQGHNEAVKVFKYQVHQDGFLSSVERKVLAESSLQVSLAYEALYENDPIKLRRIVSLKLSVVLLNQAAIHIASLVDAGILKEEEGEHYFEHLEKDIFKIKMKKIPLKQAGRATFLKITESNANALQFIRDHYGESGDSQFAEIARP